MVSKKKNQHLLNSNLLHKMCSNYLFLIHGMMLVAGRVNPFRTIIQSIGSLRKPCMTIIRHIGFVSKNANIGFYLTNSLLQALGIHLFTIFPSPSTKTNVFWIFWFRKSSFYHSNQSKVWRFFFDTNNGDAHWEKCT